MKADDLIAALALPDGCRVNQRITKKMLLENSVPGSAQNKRLINEHIDTVQWLAALKPHTIGVPGFRDEVREYLEIAVVSVALKPLHNSKHSAIAELVQRAIPYPVLLLLHNGDSLTLSLVHKRWAQNEAGKVVLDGNMSLVALDDGAHSQAFVQALALGRQAHTCLHALYQGWIDCILALQAAQYAGVFRLTTNLQQTVARRQALHDCLRLECEAASLRAQAGKETQLVRQVELNLALARVKAELHIAKSCL